jgi:hypothetical protein
VGWRLDRQLRIPHQPLRLEGAAAASPHLNTTAREHGEPERSGHGLNAAGPSRSARAAASSPPRGGRACRAGSPNSRDGGRAGTARWHCAVEVADLIRSYTGAAGGATGDKRVTCCAFMAGIRWASTPDTIAPRHLCSKLHAVVLVLRGKGTGLVLEWPWLARHSTEIRGWAGEGAAALLRAAREKAVVLCENGPTCASGSRAMS